MARKRCSRSSRKYTVCQLSSGEKQIGSPTIRFLGVSVCVCVCVCVLLNNEDLILKC